MMRFPSDIFRVSASLFPLLCALCIASAQGWKSYPYHENNTLIYFPADEGRHPAHPVEWWYTTGHVTGKISGRKYSYMLTYFYYDTVGFNGFRIFNLADDSTGAFYSEMMLCQYPVLAQTHLEINAIVGLKTEKWLTKKDFFGNLIPFEYTLTASSSSGAIDLNYIAQKRPLIVGDSGFFYQGNGPYTYYYSQTLLNVSGTLTFLGVPEVVEGTAWIDRQWGNFNPSDGENYEWFSVQLSNGMDFNIWNIFNVKNSIPDTNNYRLVSAYVNDTASFSAGNFTLQRLRYVYTPDGAKCYAQEWRFTYGNINLNFSTLHSTSEVFLPFRFYEGATVVTGTVDGLPVTGVGFAETLHSYAKPDIALTAPSGSQTLTAPVLLQWRVLNPDDGNPLYYTLQVSADGKNTFQTIASSLSDTAYLWNAAGYPSGSECWIRILAHSIDKTLGDTVTADSSFILLLSGISPRMESQFFRVIPKSASSSLVVEAGGSFIEQYGAAEVQIYNALGKALLRPGSVRITSPVTTIPLNGIEDGLYLISVRKGDAVLLNRKISVVKQ